MCVRDVAERRVGGRREGETKETDGQTKGKYLGGSSQREGEREGDKGNRKVCSSRGSVTEIDSFAFSSSGVFKVFQLPQLPLSLRLTLTVNC